MKVILCEFGVGLDLREVVKKVEGFNVGMAGFLLTKIG